MTYFNDTYDDYIVLEETVLETNNGGRKCQYNKR